MKDLIVDIMLWEQNVGSLAWDDQRDIANFEFEERFRQSGQDISPIKLPLSGGRPVFSFPENRNSCFKGLPGFVADALPDKFGDQIITEWFLRNGLTDPEITPLERLCYVGRRAMGALEFQPSHTIAGLEESTRIYIDELSNLAKDIFSKRSSFREKLHQEDKAILDILKVGTSAGGAKPKAIIAYDEATGEVRSGQVKAPEGFTYWLLKFDWSTYNEHDTVMDNPQGIGCIEYAYYMMAKTAGIEMTECRLLNEGDNHHFMTKRFDRTDTGDKIHMVTLAGMAHLDRDERHSYEEAFAVLRKLNLAQQSMNELYRRMVFNVMARNNDDHTKNLSFLMSKNGEWRLAPAYDLCYSYKPGGRWTSRHQMSLNSRQDGFTLQDLFTVGEKMGIRRYREIVGEVSESVSRWKEVAKDCGVKREHIDEIESNLLYNMK